MQSRKLAAALAVAGVAVAVALFVVLQEGEDAESPEPTTTGTVSEPTAGGRKPGRESRKPPEPEVATIIIRSGQPAGGVAELEFEKGGRIRFVVRSDIAEEVHLHGYDVTQDVAAGGRVEFDVPATIDGLFEVELEHSQVPIAEVSVVP